MSDTIRQVGDDETGTTAAHFKRDLHVEKTKAAATYKRSGKRTALEAALPAFNDVFETIGSTPFYVESADIKDGDGGTAEMTVAASAVYAETPGTLDPIGPAQYTVDFAELRRKLEAHPAMGHLSATGIANKKSLENWQDLVDADWTAAATPTGFWSGITSWDLATYKELKQKGVEEFLSFYPVLTRTLIYLGQPDDIGQRSGTRQTPPVGAYAYSDLYEWLQGADSFNQRGKHYERKTSWQAADDVSSDIYPNWTL